MKRALRILPYSGNRDYQYYLDGLRVNGKRRRLFFKTLRAAEDELKKLTKQTRKEGEDGLALSSDFRILAARCAKTLEPFGKSIWDATQFFLEHLERTKDSMLVSVLAADYQESKVRAQLSQRHLDDIKQRLGRFVATNGNRTIASFSPSEIENWLHALELGPQSTNNFRAILAAFFSYALKRELIQKNPVSAVDKIKIADAAPEIFRPSELEKLLSACSSDLLPAVVVQGFAGLRTAEVLRLDWAEVDQARCYITVSAKKSKTAKRRLIPIAENLKEWLAPYAGRTGKVYPLRMRTYHVECDNARKAAGLSTWPNNGLRHSFASYHLAKHQNAAELMLQMGHTSTRQIFDSYRELVHPEEAALYWNIKPQRPANIVPLAVAS